VNWVCATKVSCPYWKEQEENNPRGSSGYDEYKRKERGSVCNGPKRALCCPSASSISPVIAEDPTYIPRAGECGANPDSEFIFGGENTKPGEFPFSVLLGYTGKRRNRETQKREDFPIWTCSGVLINPWYVVTAGHCVKGRKSIEWVRVGAHTVQDEVDGPRYDEELPHYQQMRVTAADIIPHEDYLPRGNNIENDIALIRLPQRVETNKGTQFACLPQPSNASNAALEDWNRDTIGHKATVVGWGYSCYVNGTREFCQESEEIATTTQQFLEVPLLDSSDCRQKLRTKVSQNQVCAGGEFGKSACNGDSGGGLFIRRQKDQLAPWYLFGIVSFGVPNCEAGKPEVYVRVSEYIQWIVEKIQENN